MAQSVGAVEETDCFSAEGQDFPNEYPMAQSVEAVELTDCFSAEG